MAAYDRAVAVGRAAADPALCEAELQARAGRTRSLACDGRRLQTHFGPPQAGGGEWGDGGAAGPTGRSAGLARLPRPRSWGGRQGGAPCAPVEASEMASAALRAGCSGARACARRGAAPRAAAAAAHGASGLGDPGVRLLSACAAHGGRRPPLLRRGPLFYVRRGAQVAMVRVLHAMGGEYRGAAAAVLTGLLERSPGHAGALRAYAELAADRGMHADAARALLGLLVQRPQDTAVRRAAPGAYMTLFRPPARPARTRRPCRARASAA